jgi:HD-like signal output (HDOD) protein
LLGLKYTHEVVAGVTDISHFFSKELARKDIPHFVHHCAQAAGITSQLAAALAYCFVNELPLN